MKLRQQLLQPGVLAALLAALLFGAGTPLAKLLLTSLNPWLLAGLLYLGSGVGMTLYRVITRAKAVHMARAEWPWLLGAVLSGGVIAPVLLMFGLRGMPASGASLLLNAEGVFTALLAWFAFKENFDRRIAIGMLAILAGAAILNWPTESNQITGASLWPALAILGACFMWGLDNNLTRKVSLTDATWIAAVKGMTAGVVNLAIAAFLGTSAWPSLLTISMAMLVGLFAYGISLALFVVALRHLGTARTGAYFSVAPFFGAMLALAMGDLITLPLLIAGLLMAIGVWLHLGENHVHLHQHEPMEHEHTHTHDEHHQHEHAEPVAPGIKHRHRHRHEPLTHAHPHFPDTHHTHDH